MAIAGKVAITLSTENGGAWSADVTYDRLVSVKHNNNLYISRKTVANVEPPNNEFWFLALEGFGGEDVEALIDRMNELSDLIQAIIDGTTQVGDAKTLDGHEAEYFFPRSGGTIDGDVTVEKESGQIAFSFKNGSRDMKIIVTASGTCGVFDQTNNVWLWNSEVGGLTKFYGTASGNLPLTGGTTSGRVNVSASDYAPLLVTNKNSGGASFEKFLNGDGLLGFLGFNSENKPTFKNAEETANYDLLHTGNKPTGTYTGNGSATQRTISTGGIGEFAFVKCGAYRFAVLSESGYIGFDGASVVCGTDAYFVNGKIIESTASVLFNENGKTYTYQIP